MAGKGKRKLKVVEVSGTNYEMGFQYGAACLEIAKMLDMTCQFFGGRDKVNSLMERFLPLYLPPTEKYAPEIVAEMQGMAAGAKVDFRDILFLNITYEISVPAVMGGCTSFAASGEATAGGQVIAGQNFDFISPWEEYLILLKMKPVNAPKFLAVTAAGCLGLFGLNSAGFSLNLNLLKNKESLTPAVGVPTHVILRKVFSCESLSEAIMTIAAVEGRAAKNYLLVSAQGDIIGVETTTHDLDVQFPERGIYTHANYFKAERFKAADLAPLFLPDSYIRAGRLLQLMEHHHRRLAADVMQQILPDHNNYPGSICRHPNPKAPLPLGRIMKTLASIISCPAEQKAFIALGNPCENEYLEYKL
ncbi:MAG: C45 family peptidase [Dehalococcoidales bacterium]|jgi:isopenicillin-N N-acyltransferase-like protein